MKNIPLVSAVLCVSLLAGCAQVPENAGQTPGDPWESFNRHSYAFNDGLDRYFLKPVTEGYRFVTPKPAQDGVSNFCDNLVEPNNALNNFLQGKVSEGITSVFRFALNSTIGVLGLFDVASWVGMDRAPEDFGQTLGVWGVSEGPYLVLPLLGPSSGRDVARYPVSFATSPTLLADDWYWGVGAAGISAVDARSRMIDAGMDDMRANVVDEYVAVREAYRQMRRNLVLDGRVSEEKTLEGLTPLVTDEE